MNQDSVVRTNIPMDLSAPVDQKISKDDVVVDSFNHKFKGLNRYALACAILASTNSILLGYGNFLLLNFYTLFYLILFILFYLYELIIFI